MNYCQVDERVKELASALNSLGVKKGDNVAIYAETRADWMVSAIASFKCGLPGE